MLNLTYEYGTAAGNDGRIKKINDLVVPDRTVHFEYDGLSRLKRAHTTGGATYPAWELTWGYSATGNREAQTAVVGNPPASSLAFDPATNRVNSTGWTHDASGNVKTYDFVPTEHGGDGSFSIDAAGRVVGHTPGADPPITFAFDATGLRTKRTEGASTTLYLRDGGQVIGEWNGTSWTKEYVWLGNTLLATIEGSTIKYHHQDHLSIRATTFTDGMVGEEQGHYPFGEPWYETSPETTRIFTTYEREAGGSLDYAMFRWMGPEAGRFLAADPVHGSLGDGQSWNRYAYAGNDPVNRWDPWGLYFTEDPGPSDIGVGDGPPGGGAGGGGPSQCDPYDVSICRNTQTGEIVTCCCSGGRWVQCDFTLSEADHEPIDPVERHENWIRDTDEALDPLDENPYFGGGRGGGGGSVDLDVLIIDSAALTLDLFACTVTIVGGGDRRGRWRARRRDGHLLRSRGLRAGPIDNAARQSIKQRSQFHGHITCMVPKPRLVAREHDSRLLDCRWIRHAGLLRFTGTSGRRGGKRSRRVLAPEVAVARFFGWVLFGILLWILYRSVQRETRFRRKPRYLRLGMIAFAIYGPGMGLVLFLVTLEDTTVSRPFSHMLLFVLLAIGGALGTTFCLWMNRRFVDREMGRRS
jgi:RHS repeat-associated protein